MPNRTNVYEYEIYPAEIVPNLKNFSDRWNDGKRYCHVFLKPEDEEFFLKNNWPVKYYDDGRGNEPRPMAKLNINTNTESNYCSEIYTEVEGGYAVPCTSIESITKLDNCHFTLSDIKVGAFNYNVSGNQGVSLSLRKGYFKLIEDAIDKRHRRAPENEPMPAVNEEEIPFE